MSMSRVRWYGIGMMAYMAAAVSHDGRTSREQWLRSPTHSAGAGDEWKAWENGAQRNWRSHALRAPAWPFYLPPLLVSSSCLLFCFFFFFSYPNLCQGVDGLGGSFLTVTPKHQCECECHVVVRR